MSRNNTTLSEHSYIWDIQKRGPNIWIHCSSTSVCSFFFYVDEEMRCTKRLPRRGSMVLHIWPKVTTCECGYVGKPVSPCIITAHLIMFLLWLNNCHSWYLTGTYVINTGLPSNLDIPYQVKPKVASVWEHVVTTAPGLTHCHEPWNPMMLRHLQSKTNREHLLVAIKTTTQTNGQVPRPQQTGQEAKTGLLVLMIMQSRRRERRRN